MVKSTRLLLLAAVGLLFAIGLLMIFDTSAGELLDRSSGRDPHESMVRQLLFAILGALCGAGVALIGYRNLLRLSFPMLLVTIVLLLIVFVPGIGQMRNGAHRWLHLGPITFQPSELLKLVLPCYLIDQVLRHREQPLTWPLFLKWMAPPGAAIFLVLIEPDHSTVGVLGMELLATLWITRVPTRFWMVPAAALFLAATVAATQIPYVRARLEVYMHPELDLKGKGHQPYQARIAAGSGGLWGVGLGNSLQKLSYLPEAQNDYIAAIYAEEFGFVGTLGLISLYLFIVYLGVRISYSARDPPGAYLALALTFLFAIQAFLNLGVVSGLVPPTGLALPMVSQGGSALLINCILLGILLQIDAASHKVVKKAKPTRPKQPSQGFSRGR
jgi:cell division protein FtsW